jgi:hypothetical protein
LVHTCDVRIQLGVPFEPNLEYAESAMDFFTDRWPIGFVPASQLRGIRLSANDISRSWRAGTDAAGPVAALMMSVCGRTAALDALTGPGSTLPRRRLSA